MKKFIALLSILILISISCDDDEDPSTALDDLPGSLVATIDGETIDFRYQPRANVGTYDNGVNVFDAIFIRGTTNSNFTRELNISIVNPAIGLIELNSEALSGIRYEKVLPDGIGQAYSTYAGTGAGTITVTELGDRIMGTFNATLYDFQNDVEIIVDGSFDLEITE